MNDLEDNPFNCVKPGHLFVGYQGERLGLRRGLREGRSFAVVGGRRCGKTSLLQQLLADLQDRAPDGAALLPRYVDMQGVVPKAPLDFFRALEAEIARGVPAKPWKPPAPSQPYQAFLERVTKLDKELRRAHGPEWTFVFLLDELDSAEKSLGNDEVFQNLRNLLSVSDLRSHFRVVCSGVRGLADLVRSGSPLNILEQVTTRALTREESGELIARGFPDGLEQRVADQVLDASGGHAFILQALLSYLWELRSDLSRAPYVNRMFLQYRLHVLRTWFEDIGPSGRAVYDELLKADGNALPEPELRARLAGKAGLSAADGLSALSFHGLIEDREGAPPRVASRIFKDWFPEARGERGPTPGVDPLAAPAPAAPAPSDHPDPRHVMVVHGRNKKAHAAICALLRALGLIPLDWSQLVELTGNASPYVGEVVDMGFRSGQAVVVLFTPDDEVRLSPAYQSPNDPDYERQILGQPRPNVLFEAGVAMGKFPTRTVFVQIGRIRPMSDLAGRQFIQMDGSFQAREAFARRLLRAGCAVNLDNVHWQTAGDFTP